MKVEDGTIYYNATDDVALNKLSRHASRAAGSASTTPAPTRGSPRRRSARRASSTRRATRSRSSARARASPACASTSARRQDEATVDLPIAALVVGGNGADRDRRPPPATTPSTAARATTTSAPATAATRSSAAAAPTRSSAATATTSSRAGSAPTRSTRAPATTRSASATAPSTRSTCGAGADRAQAEDGDRLTDCETVDSVAGAPRRGTAPGGPARGAVGAPAAAPPPDTTAPRLRAGGVTRQRLGRRGIVLVVATVSEAARALRDRVRRDRRAPLRARAAPGGRDVRRRRRRAAHPARPASASRRAARAAAQAPRVRHRLGAGHRSRGQLHPRPATADSPALGPDHDRAPRRRPSPARGGSEVLLLALVASEGLARHRLLRALAGLRLGVGVDRGGVQRPRRPADPGRSG